jgi:hypothetical protein
MSRSLFEISSDYSIKKGLSGPLTVGSTSPGMGSMPSVIVSQPAPISRQVSQVVSSSPTSETTLRLEPAELGRVTLSLRGDERSMTLFVQAERPETLELIRRSSQDLAGELSDLGYENITFEFGSSGERAADDGSDFDNQHAPMIDDRTEDDGNRSPEGGRKGEGQLDIRI